MLVRFQSFGLAHAAATVLGRAAVDPVTGPALCWPAAGVGALWALLAPSRREVLVVGAATTHLGDTDLAPVTSGGEDR